MASLPSKNGATNGNGHATSSMDAVLDRMVESASASAATTAPQASFLASSSWQGSKRGYYFGTADKGTGYYWDEAAQGPWQGDSITDSHSNKTLWRKRPRDELSADELLKQAEQSVDPHSKVLDLSAKGMRHASKALEKAINRNALQRAQHADSPEEYMESELALHEQISSLAAIAADSQELFPTVLEEGIVSQLAQLLSHENSDVALSVTHVFVEWLDVDLYTPDSPMQDMARAIAAECLAETVANLGRLDASQEEDATGMEDIMTLLETLLDMDSASSLFGEGKGSVAAALTRNTTLLGWLLDEISNKQSGRATEILVLVLQQQDVHTIQPDLTNVPAYTSLLTADGNSTKKKPPPLDGLEILLQSMAKYRKTQPSTEDESDFLENICLALAAALTFSTTNVDKFLEAQGIELIMRCLKEKVHAGGVGLKLLDLRSSRKANEYIIQAGGLKYLFPLFVGRSVPKPSPASGQTSTTKARKEWLRMLETQVIHILYNLTRHLTDSSPEDAKQRLLVKFLEDDCEKCDRLIELFLHYDHKARTAEYKFYRSDVEEEMGSAEVEVAALDAKLKGGGDLFHRLGAIAAFVCVWSRKGHNHILEQLTLQQSGVGVIKAAVQEFASILDEGEQKEQLQRYLSLI